MPSKRIKLAISMEGANDRDHLCDLTLISQDNVEIKAHKVIMALASPVLDAMLFHSETKESITSTVHISDLDSQSLSLMVQAINGKELNDLTLEQAMGLLMAADKYRINDLISQTEEFISNVTDKSNCSDVIIFGRKYSGALMQKGLTVLKHNFKEIRGTQEWKEKLKNNPELNELIINFFFNSSTERENMLIRKYRDLVDVHNFMKRKYNGAKDIVQENMEFAPRQGGLEEFSDAEEEYIDADAELNNLGQS